MFGSVGGAIRTGLRGFLGVRAAPTVGASFGAFLRGGGAGVTSVRRRGGAAGVTGVLVGV